MADQKWKKETDTTWQRHYGPLSGSVALVQSRIAPERFVATGFVLAAQVHCSEHACLCKAQEAVERAMETSIAMRVAQVSAG